MPGSSPPHGPDRLTRPTGPPPTVEVWAYHPDPTLIRWLHAHERARAQRFHRPDDRARSITGAALVRAYAATRTGIAPQQVEVRRRCPGCGNTDHGIPRLPDLPGTHLSLSHSGDHVLLAAADVPVGVDVETGDAGTVVDLLGPGEPCTDPTRTWTRKEAVAKLTGRGLLLPLPQIRIRETSDGWRATVPDAEAELQVAGLDLPLGAPAAVACQTDRVRLDLHHPDQVERRLVRLDHDADSCRDTGTTSTRNEMMP